MVAKNAATQQIWRLKNRDEIICWFNQLPKDTWIIGHNILGFDLPVLNRLLGIKIPLSRCIDSLVLSYLFSPYLEGGHSLENWGERVGVRKVLVPDFANVSDTDLLRRCESDVEITQRTYLYLQDVMLKIGYSELSCEIEHWTRFIINEQERNGFHFNIPGAESLYETLRARQSTIEGDIRSLFPPRLKSIAEYDYRLKQSGDPYNSYFRHLERYPKIDLKKEAGTYQVYDWEHFNLASPNQRVSRLLDLGWTPTKFTKPSKSHPTGQPQVDEDSLVEAAQALQKPELKAMAEWLVSFGRANMINTWLKFVNRTDSRIHGKVFTCGALSRRCRHAEPNSANIPGHKARFGDEVRSLWEASPGRLLLGGDAKAAQMRLLGHYLNDPETAKLYIEGDPHTKNQEAISQGETREQAKNHFYAFIFGAQDKKLGRMNNKGPEFGKHVRDSLFNTTPGLKELTEENMQEFKQNKGRLKCIDGGYVNCPSSHSALNYKIQSAEAVHMKLTGKKVFLHARKVGIDYKQVNFVHDEYQYDVNPKDADRLSEIFKIEIINAGEELGIRVKMEGDTKQGKNWSLTH